MSSTWWRVCEEVPRDDWIDVAGETYYRRPHDMPATRNLFYADGVEFTLVASAAAVDATGEWFIDNRYVYIYDDPTGYDCLEMGHEVTMPQPDFKDTEGQEYHLTTGLTDGGKVFKEDPGYQTTDYIFSLSWIRDDEKRDFVEFWRDALENGVKSLRVSFPNNESALIKQVIFPGMKSSGTTIYPGMTLDSTTIYPGQVTAPDNRFFLDVKILGSSLPWLGMRDGWWSLSLEITKEG